MGVLIQTCPANPHNRVVHKVQQIYQPAFCQARRLVLVRTLKDMMMVEQDELKENIEKLLSMLRASNVTKVADIDSQIDGQLIKEDMEILQTYLDSEK